MIKCPKCGHKWDHGLSAEIREGMLPVEIEWAILLLWDLRKQKKYAEADIMRDQFMALGIFLKYGDTFVEYKKDYQNVRIIFDRGSL